MICCGDSILWILGFFCQLLRRERWCDAGFMSGERQTHWPSIDRTLYYRFVRLNELHYESKDDVRH